MRSMRVATRAASSPNIAVNPIQLKAPQLIDVTTTETGVHVLVSKRVFRLCWLVMMLLHCALAAFPAAIGVLYRYLMTANFMDTITGYSLAVDRVYFEPIARGYFFVSTIHTAMIVIYLVRSIRCLEPTFRPPLVVDTDARAAPEATGGRKVLLLRSMIAFKLTLEQALVRTAINVGHVLLHTVVLCMPTIGVRCFSGMFDAVKAVFLAMDIQSDNYEVYFIVREIVQTFLQTYQAYRMSIFVPRLWMTNVSTGFIVLNCWSTPLIRFFFSKAATAGTTRLSCALVSLLLDVVSYALIPLVLFYPYYQQFDRPTKTFDRRYGYTDIWLIQMINELQLLFVHSLYDAFSKLMIAISIPRWLHAITKLLRPREATTHKRQVTIASEPRQPPARVTIVRLLSSLHQTGSRRKHQFVTVGNRFLMLWGLVILVIQVHAATHPFHPQCRLRTRSWLASKPGCSLLEINCVEERVDGAAQDMAEIIERVDTSEIEHLVFRHCPRLEIPARVNTLRHLMGLKVHNSSLSVWGADAAVTTARHPMLRFIFLLDVNMTALPAGLLSSDFPQRLCQVVISRSNLTELPDTLDTIWPKRLILILEELQIPSFPTVVLRMAPLYLSLALNNLTDIPAPFLHNAVVPLLILSGNPIRSLPSKLPGFQPPFVGWLSVVSTDIEELPDWITNRGSYYAYPYITAAHTPLCRRMIASGEAATSLVRTGSAMHGIDCFTDVSPGQGNWYPLVLEAVWNPSYTLH